MKSRITIDFKGVDAPAGTSGQFEPVIRAIIEDSEDVRDSLMKAFFESLGGKSSWLVVNFDHHIIGGTKDTKTYVTISPVRPEELKETVKIIENRLASELSARNVKGFGPENYNPLAE